MKDTYQTIEGMSEGLFKDRGSKFIAYAWPAYSEDEALERVEEARKLHPKARHHCYAWRLGVRGDRFRANDDGEPSGTAGRPIHGQLVKRDLTNALVVVVRYFGGTLLGASGLINAYREAAADALAQAETVGKVVEDIFRIHFDYAIMSQVMNAVKGLELDICRQDFDASPSLDVAIRQSEVTQTLPRLRARILEKRVAELQPEDQERKDLQIELIRTRGI